MSTAPKHKQRLGYESEPLGQRGGASLSVNFASYEMALLIQMVICLGVTRGEVLQSFLALSRCAVKSTNGLSFKDSRTAATGVHEVFIASARSSR